jgi:hypothetical protein
MPWTLYIPTDAVSNSTEVKFTASSGNACTGDGVQNYGFQRTMGNCWSKYKDGVDLKMMVKAAPYGGDIFRVQCQACRAGSTETDDPDFTLYAPTSFAFGASESGSAAKGDPHFMNVKGEAFDVMQTGRMMLLEIPRASSPATLDLALHADIEHLGVVQCGPTFITSASITGRWIGEPVEIRSGPIVQSSTQSKHAFAIRFHGKDWLAHAEMQRTMELSKDAAITTQDRMFLFQVRGLDIAVSQPKRPRTFLDIQVKGLGDLVTEIGGLLGMDDHSSVEEVPSACKMSASSLSLASVHDEASQWSARALV